MFQSKITLLPLPVFMTSLLFLLPVAWAEKVTLQANVVKTMVNDDKYGVCMVALSNNPQLYLPECGNTWVSFSCDGTYSSKSLAYRKFDQAQMAFATKKEVKVYLDSTKQHNGYCYAYRIDVIDFNL